MTPAARAAPISRPNLTANFTANFTAKWTQTQKLKYKNKKIIADSLTGA